MAPQSDLFSSLLSDASSIYTVVTSVLASSATSTSTTTTSSSSASTSNTTTSSSPSSTSSASSSSTTVQSSATQQSPANATSTSPEASSSHHGTNVKLIVGITVPVVVVAVIALALCFWFLRRRRKAKAKAAPVDRSTLDEKPRLLGKHYDSVAALSRPTSEYAPDKPGLAIDSQHHPLPNRAELPENTVPMSAVSASGAQRGLSTKPSELETINGGSGTNTDSSYSRTTIPSAQQPHSPVSPLNTEHDVVASEADFLVQELGLISMRKKTLKRAATAEGTEPEDAPGMRGEDYRELVERETKLRRRIEGMDEVGVAS